MIKHHSVNDGLNNVNKKLALNRFNELAAQQKNVQKMAEPTSSTKDWEKKEMNEMSKKDESAGSWLY